jgi:hypothetical protein
MNCFYRSSHRLSVGLGPTKVAGELLKELINLPGFDRLVVCFVLFGAGRLPIVFGHGNLIANIVGEFVR